LALRLLLTAVFAVAALAKLLDLDGARQAVAAFGVPRPLVAPVAVVLPCAELAVAVALVVTPTAIAGAAGAIVLLGAFIVGIAGSLARGRPPDCQCFGRIHSEIVSRKSIVRDALLAAGAAVVVVEGPGTSLGAWSSGLTGMDLVILVVAIALVVAFVFEGSKLIAKWRQ
jgi:uncharacterized membrane protein YphA (DoxX/SURF4 family)